MNKKRIIKNIVVVCLGVFTIFLAYNGLAMLQSTMNRKHNIGIISQTILYGCFSLSALLFPKFVIKKLGSKVTYVISLLTYIPYIASNYYPHWIAMIPASILIGLGASLLWGSQATYLNAMSAMYVELTFSNKNQPKVTSSEKRVIESNKSFTGCTQSNSDIVGTTIDSELKVEELKPDNDGQQFFQLNFYDKALNSYNEKTNHIPTKNEDYTSEVKASVDEVNDQSNETVQNMQNLDDTNKKREIASMTARIFGIHGMAYHSCIIWSNLMSYFILRSGVDSEIKFNNNSVTCGAHFCNANANFSSNSNEDVSENTRYVLTTVCFSLSIIAVLLVVFFLDPLKTESEESSSSFQMFLATVKMVKREEILLLIPSSIYVGQIQGFFAGEFTKAYIGCSWGTYAVSLVLVSYGFCCTLSATSSGWLIKIGGRIFTFTLAALLNLAVIITLLLWIPNPSHPAMFFIISAMNGIYDGITWSQFRAFYGVLFRADEDAAFATFHLWYSLGFCISLAVSGYFCVYMKLYALLVVSSLGYIGYIIVERKFAMKNI